MKTKVILIGLSVVLVSCTINYRIRYSTEDVQKKSDKGLSNIVLDIEQLTDHRKDNPDNDVLFSNAKQIYNGGRSRCINSEKNYKKEPVTLQVSRMLVEHMNVRNTFMKVVLDKKDTADYYITGDLLNFYGNQDYSTAAAVGAQFGLIGALATAGAKTDGKIIFEINNLTIYDRNQHVVKKIGTFRREYKGNFHADAYCWCMFENVNAKLKDYYSELITIIENEIRDAHK
jgi:hypothetical protein